MDPFMWRRLYGPCLDPCFQGARDALRHAAGLGAGHLRPMASPGRGVQLVPSAVYTRKVRAKCDLPPMV